MKPFTLLFLILSFGFSQAQNVADYKYISVPLAFSDFDTNEYGLNNELKLLLKQKNYTPIAENRNYWPKEAQLNPCKVLTADVFNNSSLLKNKIKLIFKDCNHSKVFETEATSNIKEFKTGFKDALHKAVSSIASYSAENEMIIPTQKEVTIVKKRKIPVAKQELLPIEKRSHVKVTTQTIVEENKPLKQSAIKVVALEKGEYKLINTQTSSTLAHFYPAKKQGIYHVRVIKPSGESYYTIGYKDSNGNLSYEQQQDFESWTLINLD